MSLVLAAGGSKALWFATRGAGTVAFLALTATVVLGIAGVQRLQSPRIPRFLVAGLHRNLTLLALALLGVHIGTAVADTYAPIGLKDAVVPFFSAYRPFWLGLGALAFDLLLALTITSLVRTRIGFRRWKLLHWLAYAAWPVALVHALGTGSDARVGWMQIVAVASTLAVVAAVFVRLGRPARWTQIQLAAGAAALVVPLATAVWYTTGPGRHGWAARAGTPKALVKTQRVTAVAAVHTASAAAPTLPAPPFTTHFTGRLRQSAAGNGLVLVNIAGTTSGTAAGRLWIRLQGIPSGSGVSMTASGASFGPPSWPDEYVGKITALEGTRVGLSLRGSSGDLQLIVDLTIDQATGTVSGVVQAEPGQGESQ
jgi:methionine sulfoxide reductase heme-binding subunit